jgi:hypothetical protein
VDVTPNAGPAAKIYKNVEATQRDGVLTLRCNVAGYKTRLLVFTERTVTDDPAGDTNLTATDVTAALTTDATGLGQSFRGLHLRTHPDQDLAATWIKLEKADEIVMQNGTRVSDWGGQYANPGTSGAGGLDTGAEAASTWYEIYAIYNSTTAAKNLLLHRARNFTTDQFLSSGDDGQSSIRNVANTRTAVAQTFTPAISGERHYMNVYLGKTGTPTGRIWAEIRTTSTSTPTSTVLATSDKLDVSVISTAANHFIRFVFRTPVTLTAGTMYALVITGDWTASDVNYAHWRADTSAPPYAGGAGYALNAGTWVATAADYLFVDVVEQNNTSLTLPTGYDGYCLIGFVYNDASSNFVQFEARDRDVKMRGARLFLNAGTAAVQTLVGLTDQVPPVPVTITNIELLGTSLGLLSRSVVTSTTTCWVCSGRFRWRANSWTPRCRSLLSIRCSITK